MKEIGGYFGFEELYKKEYHEDLLALNIGRNALVYLLRARKIEKLYLPYYICDSVINVCIRENVPYEMYHIGRDFIPEVDITLKENEFLYIVNYFGQITNEMIIDYKHRYGNIIFDNVQAFFQKSIQGIDTIYSCRKFFGVPDGAYLSSDAQLDEPLEVDKSKDRVEHLLGRFEENASDYYACFADNDERFENVELRKMSRFTHNILGAVNYDSVREKREANYQFLENALCDSNSLNVVMPEGPYCYPFYCENGMSVKATLAKEKIYVPTLWPNVRKLGDCIEKEYAENILPLPCDQRYVDEDMRRIIDILHMLVK